MKFPDKYPFLHKNNFSRSEYSIVPIRYEDRIDIMKWRNEQIYHLRQKELLTEAQQEHYFSTVVHNIFTQQKPDQILFSYLKNGKCIGYGGLVHINWQDRHAEISFIMDTALEADEFDFHWKTYLELLEDVAFNDLKLHKLFTYSFDIRPHMYQIYDTLQYEREAELKEHCFFDNKFISVIIYSKINR